MTIPNVNTVKRISVSRKRWASIQYLLFALPFVALIVAFSYVPLFGWYYAFVDYKLGMGMFDMKFVGLQNFAKLIIEYKEVLRVLRNTFIMSLLGIAVSPLPIIFAIMLNEIASSKFKRIVQTVTTLPNFISWIVVYGLAWAMFSSSGLVTNALKSMGIQSQEIGLLGSYKLVWFFQLGLGIWKGLGWGAIIYLAAISGIDTEQYDAAKVDGANKLQTIWHVTVPGVIPTYLVLLLLAVSNMLNNGFEQYFVFYNSLVSDRIEVLDYYVYKIGLLCNDYAYSVAIGMLKTLLSIFLLFTVNTLSKKLRGESLI